MSPEPITVEIIGHGASEETVAAARQVSDKVLGRLAPANVERLAPYRLRLDIVPDDVDLTDLEAYEHLAGLPSFESTPDRPRTWDQIRGAGGVRKGSTISFAVSEEEVVHQALVGSATQKYLPHYGDGFLQIHETAHIVYDYALTPEQRAEVDRLHAARKADPNAAWLAPTGYTSANPEEYFANSVAALFSAPYAYSGNPDYSPVWLEKHDPKLYTLLNQVFRPAVATEPAMTTPARAAAPAWDVITVDDIPPDLRPEPRLTPPPAPPTPSASASGWRARRATVAAAMLVLVLLLAAGGALVARSGGGGNDLRASSGGGADGRDAGGGAASSSATREDTRTVEAVAGCAGTDHRPEVAATDAVTGTTSPSPSKETICLLLLGARPGSVVRIDVVGPNGPVSGTGIVAADGTVCVDIPLFRGGSYTISQVVVVDGAAERPIDVAKALGTPGFTVDASESPCVGAQLVAASPTGTPPETPQSFFAELGRAFAAGDSTFLLSRLHPLVADRYGGDQCRAYLAGLSVPRYQVEVLEVGQPEPWDWVLDGRTDHLPEAVPVRIRSTEDGVVFREVDAHLVLVDGQLRWFTDCGTPV